MHFILQHRSKCQFRLKYCFQSHSSHWIFLIGFIFWSVQSTWEKTEVEEPGGSAQKTHHLCGRGSAQPAAGSAPGEHTAGLRCRAITLTSHSPSTPRTIAQMTVLAFKTYWVSSEVTQQVPGLSPMSSWVSRICGAAPDQKHHLQHSMAKPVTRENHSEPWQKALRTKKESHAHALGFNKQ